ncbi:unnamed protein product [Caenorhabditis auriculariae]|uniref:Pyroglutamyl-peptidase I n=1 Tax=Caenorhabditis auriculariae TaxID=2777116 RepID=A0A8S1HH74_9PELO|nr:unnamed protein product [Caenorhabditis auriculariae]
MTQTAAKTVVVTGFGPFGNFSRNPSSDIVDLLEKEGIEGLNLVLRKISVVYSEVGETVPALWQEHKPDLVVHIGAHPVERTVKLEQQAFAHGYCRYDVNGSVPLNNSTCCATDVPSLITTIDCARVAQQVSEKLKLADVKLEKSEDPGRYLCGFSYFLSLNQDVGKALFIHVPAFDEKCTLETVASIVREGPEIVL